MTNREHALNLFKTGFEKHKILLQSEKKFMKGNAFMNNRNRAYLNWQYAQDEFDIFISYLDTNKVKLDDQHII
jgi:hypothetical protein